ncbi:MAG: DUF2336 domain-containing protein [Bosea sp. (in: a-proteobacteria)]
MSAVSALLRDLETTLSRGSTDERAETMARLTDLFVATSNGMSEDQIGVFDVVIGRLANAIEIRARIDLAERLADVSNAPQGVVRQLALDEIAVARPVLTRSARLNDDDLVTIASTKGRDHMLAMTERPELGESVTDYLMLRGDKVITHAVANNRGARLSRRGMGLLVTRAIKDDALQSSLGLRNDVPADLAEQLVSAAKESARRRLSGALSASDGQQIERAIERGAADIAKSVEVQGELGRFGAALDDVRTISDAGDLNEGAIAAYAAKKQTDHVVCAIAVTAKLSLPGAERVLLGTDRDSVLIVAKALGWSWPTVKALIGLRPVDQLAPHLMDKARQSFDSLSAPTAQRVMRFLQIREQAAPAQTAMPVPSYAR